uniref:Uncharacterized protein n=1 Tax=Zea mays TaxID=4577 RepID=B6UCT2_MAIZE|nr:hypothetical protein [Zea mays]
MDAAVRKAAGAGIARAPALVLALVAAGAFLISYNFFTMLFHGGGGIGAAVTAGTRDPVVAMPAWMRAAADTEARRRPFHVALTQIHPFCLFPGPSSAAAHADSRRLPWPPSSDAPGVARYGEPHQLLQLPVQSGWIDGVGVAAAGHHEPPFVLGNNGGAAAFEGTTRQQGSGAHFEAAAAPPPPAFIDFLGVGAT